MSEYLSAQNQSPPMLPGLSGSKKKLFSSSAFTARRQEVPPGQRRFPELPQSGNVGAMFGLVVAPPEQLRETELS